MAYYRPKYRRRRTYGRKKTYRRRFKSRVGRTRVRKGQNIHYFSRFVGRGVLSGANGTSETFASYHFKLTDVPGWGDFQNSYDSFKIKGVKISFIPASNVTSYQSNADFEQSAFSNRFFSVLDFNSDETFTTPNDAREYKTCKISPGNTIHKRFFYPKPTMTITESSGSYGLATIGNPWISMASNTTRYYGIKCAVIHSTLTQNVDLYVIECKYYLAFKGPR